MIIISSKSPVVFFKTITIMYLKDLFRNLSKILFTFEKLNLSKKICLPCHTVVNKSKSLML